MKTTSVWAGAHLPSASVKVFIGTSAYKGHYSTIMYIV